jgi:hypothetical protein
MFIFKIKINCTHKYELTYKNKKINEKNLSKFDLKTINNFDNIENCYILNRKIINSNTTLKSLEFIINKSLDKNELREFIINLQKLGFKSKSNTLIEFIDITNNNNYNYLYSQDYNNNSKFKIKISCNDEKEVKLTYNNKKITEKNLIECNFNFIKIIQYYFIKNNYLEFTINKFLDKNELREFILTLQKLGFKSENNTTVEFIDITDINNKYLYKINFNQHKNKTEQSKYSQILIFSRKTI